MPTLDAAGDGQSKAILHETVKKLSVTADAIMVEDARVPTLVIANLDGLDILAVKI